MTSTVVRQAESAQVDRAATTIVDSDIHPHALARDIVARLDARHRRRWEMFGSRVPGPPEIYPRVRNSGFRLDAWPGAASRAATCRWSATSCSTSTPSTTGS